MATINPNATASGHFHGAGGGRGAAFDNVAFMAGGKVITEAEARASGKKEKKEAAPIEAQAPESAAEPVKTPAQGPEKRPVDDVFKHLFNLHCNIIVSANTPKGECWHFSASNSYIINSEDWEKACDEGIALLNDVKTMRTYVPDPLNDPSDDPQLGPLMALMGSV